MRSLIAWLVAIVLVGVTLPGVTHAQTKKDDTSEKAEKKADDKDEKSDKEHREAAIKWVLSFMTQHAPPGRKTYYVEAQETKEEAEKRYRSIAEDLVEVVYDPNTKPAFAGQTGRARTISVMLGIMLFESGFGKNVDFGVGKYGRGDNGNSWCLMQMNVGKGRAWSRGGGWNIKEDRPWRYGDEKEDIVQGASGPEMVKDRRKCFTEGLRLIKVSFRSCRKQPFNLKLLVYASGRCDPSIKAAVTGSKLRMKAATKFWETSTELRKEFEQPPVVAWVKAELERREKAALAAKKAKEKDDAKKAEQDKDEKKGGSSTKNAKSKTSD